MRTLISTIFTGTIGFLACVTPVSAQLHESPALAKNTEKLSASDPETSGELTLITFSSDPRQDHILKLKTPKQGTVVITDGYNTERMAKTVSPGINEINLIRIPAGTYLVSLEDENGRVIGKAHLHYHKND